MKYRLKQLHGWLKKCNFPESIIDKAFHNAKLQGPAPKPSEKDLLPVITYYSNISIQSITKSINQELNNNNNNNIMESFGNTFTVLSQKQPTNSLCLTSSNKRNEESSTKQPGLFLCKDKRCKLCENT